MVIWRLNGGCGILTRYLPIMNPFRTLPLRYHLSCSKETYSGGFIALQSGQMGTLFMQGPLPRSSALNSLARAANFAVYSPLQCKGPRNKKKDRPIDLNLGLGVPGGDWGAMTFHRQGLFIGMFCS